MVLPLMPALALVLAAVPDRCPEARNLYESLELERAIEAADRRLAQDPSRPLGCLEVRALGLLVLGRDDEARIAFAELFERAPEHPVRDPSLSPSMRRVIDAIREEVRPLDVQLRARWLSREALRLDVLLQGGLRGARSLRYRAAMAPRGESSEGRMELTGRTGSATIATGAADVSLLSIAVEVLDERERIVHRASREVLAGARPELAPSPEDSGVSWPVWIGVGAAAIAATTAIVLLSQPDAPAPGRLGRVGLDP